MKWSRNGWNGDTGVSLFSLSVIALIFCQRPLHMSLGPAGQRTRGSTRDPIVTLKLLGIFNSLSLLG